MSSGRSAADGAGSAQAVLYACTDAQLLEVAQLLGGDPSSATAVCSTTDVAGLGVTNAVLQWTVLQLRQAQQAQVETAWGLDQGYLLISAFLVFMMQAGFALYAAGVIRGKNMSMILLKNMSDAAIGSMTWYLVGFGFAFGEKGGANGFIGNWDFALSETTKTHPAPWAYWFWNWAFAAASTTILSGSVAERATYESYVIYSATMTIWVYPVVAHWIWSRPGWLSAFNEDSILGSGAIDFAGSGVVHMVGGCASLVAALVTGPRTGRFDNGAHISAFRGNQPALYVLGTLLLWFGWFGFNPGSHLGVSTYQLAESTARTAVVTTLSGGAGAVSASIISFSRNKTWDLLVVCTGALSGLVAVTAGCAVLEPWASILVGAVAAPIYIFGDELMERLRIDDPVGAFSVHGLCGAWGVFFVGLLAKEEYIVEVYKKPKGSHLMGIFYGGHGQLLLCQVIAVVVIAAWSIFWIGLIFMLLKKAGLLRVSLEHEAMGLDGVHCGEHGKGVNPNSITKFSTTPSMAVVRASYRRDASLPASVRRYSGGQAPAAVTTSPSGHSSPDTAMVAISESSGASAGNGTVQHVKA